MDDQTQSPQTDQTQKKKKKLDLPLELYEWSRALLQAVIAVVLIFAFIASVYSVKGDSMLDTLVDKQMLLISRLAYTPAHNDIIMFTKYGLAVSYTGQQSKYAPLVKRVIGIPGDRLEFDIANSRILRNGEPLDEPYIREEMIFDNIDQTIVEVPEGCVYVMGDNRNHSHDSRRNDVGLVDERTILGRVLLRIAPLSEFGTVD